MFWKKHEVSPAETGPNFKKEVERAVKPLVEDAMAQVENHLTGIRNVADLSAKVKELNEQILSLKSEKASIEAKHKRDEEEIEHKLGLHKKQVEQDIALAKREATVALREENLKADRDRFEKQMEFVEKRFGEQVTYLKDIVKGLTDRLPSMAMTADLSPNPRKR